MKTYMNEFTREYWRGHGDRGQAPDYVQRQMYPYRLTGRIGGVVTDDQQKLADLRQSILNDQFPD